MNAFEQTVDIYGMGKHTADPGIPEAPPAPDVPHISEDVKQYVDIPSERTHPTDQQWNLLANFLGLGNDEGLRKAYSAGTPDTLENDPGCIEAVRICLGINLGRLLKNPAFHVITTPQAGALIVETGTYDPRYLGAISHGKDAMLILLRTCSRPGAISGVFAERPGKSTQSIFQFDQDGKLWAPVDGVLTEFTTDDILAGKPWHQKTAPLPVLAWTPF